MTYNGLSMIKKRTYSFQAKDAVSLLGKQIKLARMERKWSLDNLAERTGISRVTLQKIEAGKMTSSIGLVFEAAVLVGVPLFEQDNQKYFNTNFNLVQSKIALLPKRTRSSTKVVDDDF